MFFILQHEFQHIKNWDVLYKMILTFVLCLHWFNPLAWVMWFLATRDIEHYCDVTLLKKTSHKTKKEYASALVEMEAAKAKLLYMSSFFSSSSTESRIKYILQIRNTSKLTILFAMSIVIGIIFLSSGEITPNNAITDAQQRARLEDNFNISNATLDDYTFVFAQLKEDDYQNLSIDSFRDL